MSIAEFVSHLQTLDVRLSAEGERVRVNAPKGVLTEILRAQIAERKQELLAFLCGNNQSSQFVLPRIIPRKTGNAAPLSFAQERLWFLEQLEPGRAVYNICRASRLTGQLNLSALEASLNEIVRRHEVLRSAIRVAEGRPVQIVEAPFELKVSVTDLQRMSDHECEQTIRQRIQEQAEAPFEFATGKFLRAELLRLADDKHVLLLATHHIVSDAWSMGILTRELWTLYEAFANGGVSPLADLPIQYSDFAAWQKKSLQGEVLDSQLAYWKKQLSDISILNLPTDRLRPVRQSHNGVRVALELPESMTAAINQLSQSCNVTPFMTLLAVFQVLLYRYTGQEDIVTGSPIANRNRSELEPLIGFFVNTLVLRVDLSGSPSFTDLLSRVREECLDAYSHQDLSFEKLVEELKPERDLSRNPLFQVMFALQNATKPFSPIDGLRVEPVEIEAARTPFDLSIFLRERDSKYIGYIEYSTDLFNRDRMERMAGHFQTLLEGIIANPNQPMLTLPILPDSERHQILIEWNETAADYPRDRCIHELFEEQADRTPDAIVIEFEEQRLTYGELNARANQLAHHLISLGVGPESLVGICIERSIEMVVGLLGILKAGGAYVPLDPAYPKDRLAFMLKDAQVSVLLTQEGLVKDRIWKIDDSDPRSSILDPQMKVVCLDSDRQAIEREPEGTPRTEVRSDNLAYVIYTSGSTGKPKGVAIEHRNTVNLLQWAKTVFGKNELAGVLASTSICFDLSVFELFVAMTCGGKVILAGNALCLHDLAAKQEITLINTVPSVVAQMLALSPLPESVRVVNLAGEPLKSELVEELYKEANVEKVYDLYGPSETTTYSTFTLRTREGPTTIGRPVANTCVFILDSRLQPVPVGVEGDLYLGGDGLARGYLNRPEVTLERFVPHPFSDVSADRFYWTGDRARYQSDGNIEFLGRTDNQVKIRGYRIELGEIEAVLNQHPTIKESIVVVRDRDSSGEKDLIAYFVPKETSVAISGLRNFLRDKLPDYMVPSLFVELEVFPVLPNGKINRIALRLPGDTRPELKEIYVEPRTQAEELLVQIWEEVLKIDAVGIHDNFFELGGHSLLAVQIISWVRVAFDKDVPLSALFDAPTVAGLAATIEETISGKSNDLSPIVRVSRDGPISLSMNQEHLWRLDQMIPGTRFFNIPYIYRLSGNLNVEALEQAVREIVRRHDTLRTVFDVVCGQPMQVVYEVTDIHLAFHDLRSTEPDIIAGRAAAVMLEEREYPFQLATGPLYRVALVRLTETESLLLITMHHIVSDYWSMQIFSRELASIYEHIVCGKPLAVTQPTIQFADYAQWERRMLETGAFDKDLDFWRRQLAPPPTKLRFRKGSEPSTSANFLTSRRSFEFDEHLVAAVKAFAKVEKCTTSMVFLTALNILLFSETGHTDIRVGLLMANRGDLQTAGTIGHFMNTVVIRTRLAPDMTCHQLLYRVRAGVLAAHSHQQLPFEYLANVLEEQDRINRASLFQVLVMYRYSTAQAYELSGVRFAPVLVTQPDTDSEVMMTTHDLVLEVRETSTQLTGSVNFSVASGCEIVNSLAGRLATILRQMISEEFDKKIGAVADMQSRNSG